MVLSLLTLERNTDTLTPVAVQDDTQRRGDPQDGLCNGGHDQEVEKRTRRLPITMCFTKADELDNSNSPSFLIVLLSLDDALDALLCRWIHQSSESSNYRRSEPAECDANGVQL